MLKVLFKQWFSTSRNMPELPQLTEQERNELELRYKEDVESSNDTENILNQLECFESATPEQVAVCRKSLERFEDKGFAYYKGYLGNDLALLIRFNASSTDIEKFTTTLLQCMEVVKDKLEAKYKYISQENKQELICVKLHLIALDFSKSYKSLNDKASVDLICNQVITAAKNLSF